MPNAITVEAGPHDNRTLPVAKKRPIPKVGALVPSTTSFHVKFEIQDLPIAPLIATILTR